MTFMPQLQMGRMTPSKKGDRLVRFHRFAAHGIGQPQDQLRLAVRLELLRQAGRMLLGGSGLSLLATDGSLRAFSTIGTKAI